jgi:hypothetical protein
MALVRIEGPSLSTFAFLGNMRSIRRVEMILTEMWGSIGGCLVTLHEESAADAPVRKPTGVADARAGAVPPCFSSPSFTTFTMLVAGLAARPAGRTVCGMLTGAGAA